MSISRITRARERGPGMGGKYESIVGVEGR